jgi:hypothetical protein
VATAASSSADGTPSAAGGTRSLHESWWRRLFGRRT